MALAVGIGKLQERFNNDVGLLKRSVMIKLFGAVVKSTPVGNPAHWNLTDAQKRAIIKSGYTGGQLRAAWRFSVGIPDTEKRVNFSDPTDKITRQVSAQVDEKDGSVFLTNAMPYAGAVEYDGHSHTKAPEGMVRVNLIRFARNIERLEIE